jgi:hypothetical protein
LEVIDLKRSLLAAVCLACLATAAVAQNGSIMVFSDPGGADCNIVAECGEITTVYVFHVRAYRARSSEWKIHFPEGWFNVGERSDFASRVGNSSDGVSIHYDWCTIGTFPLMTIDYYVQTATPPCTLIGIDVTLVQNCEYEEIITTGGSGVVNNDGTCSCNVPVESTTWGGIKALYK